MVREEGSWLGLAHKSAEITSSSGGQMSIYTIFQRLAMCVCVHMGRVCFRGNIRSIGMRREAYRQLT